MSKPPQEEELRKEVIYEGGLLVPSLIEWPAKNLKGKSNLPACTSDMLPTLLSMAGIKADFPHVLDGIDVSDAIYGKGYETQ